MGRFMTNSLSFKIVFVLSFSIQAHAQPFWAPTDGPLNSHVLALATNASGHIFAGLEGNGLYRSTNHGASWLLVTAGLTNTFIYSITVGPNGDVFCGTSGGGVFRSTDNGEPGRKQTQG